MTIDTRWRGVGVTAAIPDGSPLSFIDVEGWAGLPLPGVTWSSFLTPLDVDQPFLVQDLGPYQQAYSFATLMAPPFEQWGPPGTYVVGSAVLDTSAAAGISAIDSLFVRSLDGLAIDDGHPYAVFSDDATFLDATLRTAHLSVVPEPCSPALLGLGLALLSRHRSRVQRRRHGMDLARS